MAKFPNLPWGQWLNSAEISLHTLLHFLKDPARPEQANHSERVQRAIKLMEEAHWLLAAEGEAFVQQKGIPRGFRRLPALEEAQQQGSIAGIVQLGLVVIALGVSLWVYTLVHGDPFMQLEGWGLQVEGSLFLFLLGGGLTWMGLIVLHEGLHGLCLWLFTGKWPRFVRVPQAIGPVFDEVLTRGRYLGVLATPFVVLTVAGALAVAVLPPDLAIFAALGLFLNIVYSSGDLYAIGQLLRAGPSARGTAWGIYAPPRDDRA